MAWVLEKWELSRDMIKHNHLVIFDYESDNNRAGERNLQATPHIW